MVGAAAVVVKEVVDYADSLISYSGPTSGDSTVGFCLARFDMDK